MKFRELLLSLTFGSQTGAPIANSAPPFGPHVACWGQSSRGVGSTACTNTRRKWFLASCLLGHAQKRCTFDTVGKLVIWIRDFHLICDRRS